ncbi:hypothetical protein H0H93_004947 [Arthromyces matolae]|nr:hypothetical protein H0H93_004947 [Arthromyces matolae]
MSRIEPQTTGEKSERPPISPNAQKDVLDAIIETLSGVAAHNVNRKRKRMLAHSRPQKKRRVDTHDQVPTNISNGPTSAMDIDLSLSETVPLERPPVLEHLLIGINEVTKRLEQQIRALHSDLISTKLEQVKSSPPLRLIAVCRADIDPPILVDHLPHLVAAFNSLQPEEPITLVSLQAGAETLLSQAVGLRRAAVLGFDVRLVTVIFVLLKFVWESWSVQTWRLSLTY